MCVEAPDLHSSAITCSGTSLSKVVGQAEGGVVVELLDVVIVAFGEMAMTIIFVINRQGKIFLKISMFGVGYIELLHSWPWFRHQAAQ